LLPDYPNQDKNNDDYNNDDYHNDNGKKYHHAMLILKAIIDTTPDHDDNNHNYKHNPNYHAPNNSRASRRSHLVVPANPWDRQSPPPPPPPRPIPSASLVHVVLL
jgi:hypothetical protein